MSLNVVVEKTGAKVKVDWQAFKKTKGNSERQL